MRTGPGAQQGADSPKKRKLVDVTPRKEAVLTKQEALNALLSGKMNKSVCNKLYNKHIWERIRFDENHVYEDVLIEPQIIEQSNRIAVIPQVLLCYRWRKGSITKTITIDNMHDYIFAHKTLEKYVKNLPESSAREGMRILREETLRGMIVYWAAFRKTIIPQNEKDILLTEIYNYADDNVSCNQIRSKVAWWLFQHCSFLLLPAQAVFRWLKGFFGGDRGVIA